MNWFIAHCLFDYFQPVVTQGGLLSMHALSTSGLLHIHLFIHMLFIHTLEASPYNTSLLLFVTELLPSRSSLLFSSGKRQKWLNGEIAFTHIWAHSNCKDFLLMWRHQSRKWSNFMSNTKHVVRYLPFQSPVFVLQFIYNTEQWTRGWVIKISLIINPQRPRCTRWINNWLSERVTRTTQWELVNETQWLGWTHPQHSGGVRCHQEFIALMNKCFRVCLLTEN